MAHDMEWIQCKPFTCYYVGAICLSALLGIPLVPQCIDVFTTWELRKRIRTRFHIPGSDCEDAMYSIFCSCCVTAQMARHLYEYEAPCEHYRPCEQSGYEALATRDDLEEEGLYGGQTFHNQPPYPREERGMFQQHAPSAPMQATEGVEMHSMQYGNGGGFKG